MYTVYVLMSGSDGKLYTGYTDALDVRIRAHNAGKVRSTKGRRPLTLVYAEQYDSVTEARKRENFLKCGQGRKYLQGLLRRDGRVVDCGGLENR